MRILLTGHEGAVGTEIRELLEPEHEIVGLEAKGTFREWYDAMYRVMDEPLDAVVHAGAISANQSQRDDMYLWNSYATFLLAQRTRQKMNSMSPMPFVFFSSFLVESTIDNWEGRSPYAWSKAQGENFVRVYLPHASIVRPAVIWGRDHKRKPEYRSVPYRLASHDLKYLFRGWGRYYIHVSDVARAVRECLIHRHKGTYSLAQSVMWMNEDLAELVEWSGYEWIDKPETVGHRYILHKFPKPVSPPVPGWKPEVRLKDELPQLERALNG